MSRHIIFKSCTSVWLIWFFIVIFCWTCNDLGCLAQGVDDFQDDAGSDTSGNDATNDMLDNDPNTLNPQKNMMSGNDDTNIIMDNNQGRSIAQCNKINNRD